MWLTKGRDREVTWPDLFRGRWEGEDGKKKAKLEEGRPAEVTNRDNDGSGREDQCRDSEEVEYGKRERKMEEHFAVDF